MAHSHVFLGLEGTRKEHTVSSEVDWGPAAIGDHSLQVLSAPPLGSAIWSCVLGKGTSDSQ